MNMNDVWLKIYKRYWDKDKIAIYDYAFYLKKKVLKMEKRNKDIIRKLDSVINQSEIMTFETLIHKKEFVLIKLDELMSGMKK